MKFQKHILNTLLLLILIYFSQNALYERGSIVSRSALFIMLAISSIYFIKTLLQKGNKNLFYKAITVFLLLNILGIVFWGDITNPYHFGQFKNTLLVALTFYPIYFFSKKKILTDKKLVCFFLVMIIIAIINFYVSREQILLIRSHLTVDIVNNVAYQFVVLIPFLFLLKDRKVTSMALLFLIMFFIIQGSKRGALIAGIIGSLFFIYYQFRTIDKKYRVRGYLYIFLVVIAFSIYFYNNYMSNEYFQMRINSMIEGDVSGRDVIYANLFNVWYNTDSLVHLLFGFGYTSSMELSMTGNLAHNDWLELLTGFGLMGVIIYLAMFYAAIKFAFDKETNNGEKVWMLAIVSIWFFITMVSMSYANSKGLYNILIIAYLMGSNAQEKAFNYIK